MIPLFTYGNCQSDLLGSGQTDCELTDFGDLLGTALVKPSFKLSIENDSLNQATWGNLIKDLKLFPYAKANEVTDNTEDNEINTSTLGIIETIRQGKPYFALQFRKGGCYHKSLANKVGFGKWSTILMFEKGLLFRHTVDKSELKGFTTGDVSIETLRFKIGSDLQRSEFKFQLLNPDEINKYHVFFTWEQLGFNAYDINGVIDTNLNVVVNSATSLNVQVTSACNGSVNIQGLDEASMWSISGSTVSTVSYNSDTKTYTLTTSNLADGNHTLKLSQDGYDVVEDLDGGLYKGQKTFTITTPSV